MTAESLDLNDNQLRLEPRGKSPSTDSGSCGLQLGTRVLWFFKRNVCPSLTFPCLIRVRFLEYWFNIDPYSL